MPHGISIVELISDEHKNSSIHLKNCEIESLANKNPSESIMETNDVVLAVGDLNLDLMVCRANMDSEQETANLRCLCSKYQGNCKAKNDSSRMDFFSSPPRGAIDALTLTSNASDFTLTTHILLQGLRTTSRKSSEVTSKSVSLRF